MNQPEVLLWRQQHRVPQPSMDVSEEKAARFNMSRHTGAAFCCFYVSYIDRLFQIRLIRMHIKDKMVARISCVDATEPH